MTPILAFDIETIPDCEGIRRVHGLPADLSDRAVAEVAFQKRRAQSGGASDFLPVQLQRVVVISCVLRNEEGLRVFSIGEPEAGEAAAIQRFFEGVNKYMPQLVTWNGRSFDLPVLVNRGLIHGVGAQCFWDTGDDNKYNNYINRFHERHCDLMDVLSIYGGRGGPRRAGAARRSMSWRASRASQASSGSAAVRSGTAISRAASRRSGTTAKPTR